MRTIFDIIKGKRNKPWRASVLNECLIEIRSDTDPLPARNSRVLLYMHSDVDIIDAYSNKSIGSIELPVAKGTVINVDKRSASVKLDGPIAERYLNIAKGRELKVRDENGSRKGVSIMARKLK